MSVRIPRLVAPLPSLSAFRATLLLVAIVAVGPIAGCGGADDAGRAPVRFSVTFAAEQSEEPLDGRDGAARG